MNDCDEVTMEMVYAAIGKAVDLGVIREPIFTEEYITSVGDWKAILQSVMAQYLYDPDDDEGPLTYADVRESPQLVKDLEESEGPYTLTRRAACEITRLNFLLQQAIDERDSALSRIEELSDIFNLEEVNSEKR